MIDNVLARSGGPAEEAAQQLRSAIEEEPLFI